jgi:hypothetical protein
MSRALVVVALGIGVGLLGLCRAVNTFDEGMILVGAERVLQGEVPFKDFFALYPPGQYYSAAMLLAWFDHPVVTLRAYCIAVRALIALLLYLEARRFAGPTLALACWGASILWLTSLGSYGYPVFPALLLVLLTFSLLARAVDPARTEGAAPHRVLFAAGASLGMAAVFRHDLAFYGLVASTPFLIAPALQRSAPSRGVGPRAILAARLGWPYAAGIALLFGVPAIGLLAMAPLHEVVFELFTYPATTYAPARGLPYPPLFRYAFTSEVLTSPVLLAKNLMNVAFYAPLLFYAMGAGWLAWRIARRRREVLSDPEWLALASLVLLGALAFNMVRVRADAIHGTAMIVPSYVVAAFLMNRCYRSARLPGLLGAAAVSGVCLLSLLWPVRNFPLDTLGGLRATASAPRGEGAEQCRDFGSDRVAAAAFLRSVVPPGGRIFVGCGRHDKVLTNEPILYLLAERLPGTKYHTLDPGIVTTLDVQRDIVDDLIRHRVEYVALSTTNEDWQEPNLSSVSSGVFYLDEYLRSNYRAQQRFGPHLTILKRSAPWEREGDRS